MSNSRNMYVKIARTIIERGEGFSIDKEFKEADLANIFYLREKERKSEGLLIKENQLYRFSDDTKSKVKKIQTKKDRIIKDVNLEEIKKEYIKEFEENIKDKYKYNIDSLYEKYIKPLHWHFLPIYDEVMLSNRNLNPEVETKEYYDHYHSLEDLYRVCIGKEMNWKTLKGDINLNEKLKFEVYTNRWGHKDTYTVTRLYDGWRVENIAIMDTQSPSGEAFISMFNQDIVNYPIYFSDIIEELWNIADKTEMSIDELQAKLNDVAEMVSASELATPRWCR